MITTRAHRKPGTWPEEATFRGVTWKVVPQWDGDAPGVEHLPHGHWWLRHEAGLDHLYRLQAPEHPTIYVTEPYDISNEELLTYAAWGAAGWLVYVLPHRALWYPGHTIAVWCRRAEFRPDGRPW